MCFTLCVFLGLERWVPEFRVIFQCFCVLPLSLAVGQSWIVNYYFKERRDTHNTLSGSQSINSSISSLYEKSCVPNRHIVVWLRLALVVLMLTGAYLFEKSTRFVYISTTVAALLAVDWLVSSVTFLRQKPVSAWAVCMFGIVAACCFLPFPLNEPVLLSVKMTGVVVCCWVSAMLQLKPLKSFILKKGTDPPSIEMVITDVSVCLSFKQFAEERVASENVEFLFNYYHEGEQWTHEQWFSKKSEKRGTLNLKQENMPPELYSTGCLEKAVSEIKETLELSLFREYLSSQDYQKIVEWIQASGRIRKSVSMS